MHNSFKVATFNLFNFVLPDVNYYGKRHYDQSTYDKKKYWIVGQLRNMDADVVGFQEIFHEKALQQTLKQSGIYDNASLIVGERYQSDGSPLPANGIVTRHKVIDSSYITHFPDTGRIDYDGVPIPLREFSRPVLRVQLEAPNGLRYMVLVVHLKSKRPMYANKENHDDPVHYAIASSRSLIRRAAESVALRAVLVNLMKDTQTPVIVMGDINDAVTAVTSEIIAGAPPWRYTPPDKKRELWDVLLYNVKDIQARRSYHDVYYTHIHNGHYESLDHIFVSEEFVSANPKHIGDVRNVRTFNDHLIDDSNSNDSVPLWQSDHATVVSEIKLRETGG